MSKPVIGDVDVSVYHVELLVAVRGGGDPGEWDWDELIGDPPIDDPNNGTLVLSYGANEVEIDDLDSQMRAVLSNALLGKPRVVRNEFGSNVDDEMDVDTDPNAEHYASDCHDMSCEEHGDFIFCEKCSTWVEDESQPCPANRS